MIRSLVLDGYRGFARFEMPDLASVNVLVGMNNSGKTSILEALLLVAVQADPFALWHTMNRRGERFQDERESRPRSPEIDICHLFHGHEFSVGSTFTISVTVNDSVQTISYGIAQSLQPSLPFTDDSEALMGTLALVVRGGVYGDPTPLDLTVRGGLSLDTIRRRAARIERSDDFATVNFIGTESLSSDELGGLWRYVALTPEEDQVVAALRSVDPRIERIAFVGGESRYMRSPVRGGFAVKCSDAERPIPIGSMGDGIWRMLSLTLGTIRSNRGFLLVDEIDTGLHYTVMRDMWRLIRTISSQFGVQVFATTHSKDCVQSLAAICRQDAIPTSEVAIHRIEPGAKRSVVFSEPEIAAAAERGIEVR